MTTTQKLGEIFARFRLFARVALHGCRIVSVDTLECEKCDYTLICKDGYFRSKE